MLNLSLNQEDANLSNNVSSVFFIHHFWMQELKILTVSGLSEDAGKWAFLSRAINFD